MRSFFAWFGKSILLPLLPALVGSVMRSMYSGHWNLASIDAAELSFCVALVGIFALTGVTRLSDRQLRDALSPLFVMAFAIALCLFAGSLLMNEYHQAEQFEILARLKASNPTDLSLLASMGREDRCIIILSQLRMWSLVACAFTVVLAVVARCKYNIEEDSPLAPTPATVSTAGTTPPATTVHDTSGSEGGQR